MDLSQKKYQMLLLPKLVVCKICMYMAKNREMKQKSSRWITGMSTLPSFAYPNSVMRFVKITWSQKNSWRLPRTEAKGTSSITNCSLLINEICIEIPIWNAYFRVCMPAPEKKAWCVIESSWIHKPLLKSVCIIRHNYTPGSSIWMCQTVSSLVNLI